MHGTTISLCRTATTPALITPGDRAPLFAVKGDTDYYLSGAALRPVIVSFVDELDGHLLTAARKFGLRTYRAQPGDALVFSCSLLHEATPVTAGRRFCTLPFLYDEAAEQIRLRNLDQVLRSR